MCHDAWQGRETAAEKRYRKLLLSGLELNKDFYFSYTYNLARTLQANLTADAPADPFDSMFVWNEYLSRYTAMVLHSLHIMPVPFPMSSCFGDAVTSAATSTLCCHICCLRNTPC